MQTGIVSQPLIADISFIFSLINHLYPMPKFLCCIFFFFDISLLNQSHVNHFAFDLGQKNSRATQ